MTLPTSSNTTMTAHGNTWIVGPSVGVFVTFPPPADGGQAAVGARPRPRPVAPATGAARPVEDTFGVGLGYST